MLAALQSPAETPLERTPLEGCEPLSRRNGRGRKNAESPRHVAVFHEPAASSRSFCLVAWCTLPGQVPIPTIS